MIYNKRFSVSQYSCVLLLCLFFEFSSYWKVTGAYENTDYFSSVCGLETLLQTESRALVELQNYVDTLAVHLEYLQSEMDVIKAEHFVANENPEEFLNNPVNAFRLIKRLHNDWTSFEEKILSENSKTIFINAMSLQRETMKFPTQADVFGAATALIRLQDTYKLNATDVSNGILNGNKYGTEMTWLDCLQLSHLLFEMKDFPHTIPWLDVSVHKLIDSEYYAESDILDVLETVLQYFYQMNNFDKSLELVNYILALDYDRLHLFELKSELENLLEVSQVDIQLSNLAEHSQDYHKSNEYKLYEMVCREELPASFEQNKLQCQYAHNNVAYRLIQPFKIEILNHDPYIVQFHDILTDEEMDCIKNLARPHLSRSLVQADNEKNATVTNYRTSKGTWFSYETHKVLEKLRLEFEDAAGLNTKYAEDLQVANYGIAGHFEPHWDFFGDDDFFDPLSEGNRLATGIFYLSNVEEGGGTAFPFLNVLVKPKKGSMLFWYNLHASEERDYRTKHAACPVLKGSKWIANVWVRIRGQERERPCNLQPEQVHLQYRDYD